MTDNGRQLTNKKLKKFCNNLGVKHLTSSIEHPQTNDRVEEANKVIIIELRKGSTRQKEGGLKNYQRYCGLIGAHPSLPLGSHYTISLMALMLYYL